MWLLDRLTSFMTGLGTHRDKSANAVHMLMLRDRAQLENAYRTNWIARKAIEIIPFDMLREWRNWQTDDAKREAIEDAEKALNVPLNLFSAMVRGRLYGGALLIIGTGDQDYSSELNIDRLGKDCIKFIRVLNRHQVQPGEVERNVLSPYFGEPKFYEVNGANGSRVKVHPSRAVRFRGSHVADEQSMDNECWSDSVLQPILDAVDNATSTNQHIAAMIPEAKTDIISVPGLSDMLNDEEQTRLLVERFSQAAQIKSMFGFLLMDGDGKNPDAELYQQKQLTFTSLPDVAKLMLTTAAAAIDVPATRFLSQSPSGLNATGDSDTRNHYDNIAARQRLELTPQLRRFDRILIRHALGNEPKGLWYIWSPLYQPSEKEKTEAAKGKAETLKVVAESALIPDTILAEGAKGFLIDCALFPGIDKAFADHGDKPLVDPDADKEGDLDGLGEDGLPVEPDAAEGKVVQLAGRRRPLVKDAAPRTLYVSRKLKNAGDVLAWARSAGCGDLKPASDLHVTIAHSLQALDWMTISETWRGEEVKIDAGGPRVVEQFGDVYVLSFVSSELKWRWREIKEAGASWEHEGYQPHVTFAMAPQSIDIMLLQAYNGPLIFGPEIFETIDPEKSGGKTK